MDAAVIIVPALVGLLVGAVIGWAVQAKAPQLRIAILAVVFFVIVAAPLMQASALPDMLMKIAASGDHSTGAILVELARKVFTLCIPLGAFTALISKYWQRRAVSFIAMGLVGAPMYIMLNYQMAVTPYYSAFA